MSLIPRRGFMAGVGALLAGGCAKLMAGQQAPYPVSDHCDGYKFFNVYEKGEKSFMDLIRWQTGREAIPWPAWIDDPVQPVPSMVASDDVSVTFLGHASFYLQIGGLRILIDPVFSDRASPVSFAGPKRVRAPGQPLAALPGVDLLLISHNHYDHLDVETLRQANALWSPRALTSLGTDTLLVDDVGLADVAALDWWQQVRVGEVLITYVPAQHFAARGLFDRNHALWGGFVIQAVGRTIYFAADSGYCPHFVEIGQRFPQIDMALLPIGAYEPRWFMRPMHMNPDEAVQAMLDLGARQAIAMHYGTFAGLTDEGIDDPVIALKASLTARHVPSDRFRTLAFGQTMVIDPAQS